MLLKENLIRLMDAKSFTISKLSEITGVSIPSLKRLRSQDSNPTLDILIKLSEALDVSISELVKKQSDVPVYYQDSTVLPSKNDKEFILIFTRDTFTFKNGTRALFKKRLSNEKLTKYVMYNNAILLETLGDDLFKDEDQNILSLNVKDIFAIIVKQFYEVTYV